MCADGAGGGISLRFAVRIKSHTDLIILCLIIYLDVVYLIVYVLMHNLIYSYNIIGAVVTLVGSKVI